MNLGNIRLMLAQLAPGISADLIDGWIQKRYTSILDELNWKRQQGESVLQVPASYQTGTVSPTQGSNSLVGSGTTWTLELVGRTVRVANGPEIYGVVGFTDATHITLDRAYEGVTASGVSYRIDQSVFVLPANVRVVEAVKPLHGGPPIELVSPAELNRISASRSEYGIPRWAAPSFDAVTDPPALTLELYPIPYTADGTVLSFAYEYSYDQNDIDPNSSPSLLPWVRPAALIEGVTADIRRFQATANIAMLSVAQAHENEFDKLVAKMRRIDAAQRPAEPIRLADAYTRHRYRSLYRD